MRIRQNSRSERLLRSLAGGLVAVIAWSLTFTAAYLITAQIFPRIGVSPAPIPLQIINAIVALGLLILIGSLLSRVFRKNGWAQQMRMLQPLIDAMGRIARGDFSVRVEQPDAHSEERANDPITQLFVGVNQMAQGLNQMELLRQEFVSDVSHEIQSPLASIRGFAQALRSDGLDATTRAHYIDVIETESTRLAKLSDNLLALTSLESGTQKIQAKLFRIDQQVKRAILTSEPQWLAKHIDIGIDSDEVSVTADEDMLNQVWTNLIHNAIKFTPAGGRINIAVQARPGWVDVSIADDGIGISAEDQARIFERFFKADASRNRERGGSGLGLAIVSKIVALHGGHIRVQSELGHGATFIVSLPNAPLL